MDVVREIKGLAKAVKIQVVLIFDFRSAQSFQLWPFLLSDTLPWSIPSLFTGKIQRGGGSKSIWAMSIYTDHVSKQGFPNNNVSASL